MMFELCKNEMDKELEIKCRRIRHDLNNFYMKNNVAYWVPPTEDKGNASQTRDEQEGGGTKYTRVDSIGPQT